MPELNLTFAPEPPWLQGRVDTSKALRDTLASVDSAMRRREQNTMLPLRERAAQQDIQLNDLKTQDFLQQRDQLLKAREQLSSISQESAKLFESGDSFGAMNYLLSAGQKNPLLYQAPEFQAMLKNGEMSVKTQQARNQLEMMANHYAAQDAAAWERANRPDQGQSFRPSDPIQLKQAYDDAVAKGDQMGIEYYGGLMREATGRGSSRMNLALVNRSFQTIQSRLNSIDKSPMTSEQRTQARNAELARLQKVIEFGMSGQGNIDASALEGAFADEPAPPNREIGRLQKALEELQRLKFNKATMAKITKNEEGDYEVKEGGFWVGDDDNIDTLIKNTEESLRKLGAGPAVRSGVTMPPQESTGRNQPQLNLPTIRYNSTNDTITPR